MFAGQGVAPMNLRASVSLCETMQAVVTYPLLSCGTSLAYNAGVATEVTVEISVAAGGVVLRQVAKRTSGQVLRSAASAEVRGFRATQKAIQGGHVHHINPLKGHPGGKTAYYPLPFKWAAKGRWNMAYISPTTHTALHRQLRQYEAFHRAREISLLVRIPAVALTSYVNEQTKGCWDSVEISVSASAERSGMNVWQNAVPASVSVQLQELGIGVLY